MCNISDFEAAVYQAVRCIPRGKVVSYKQVTASIGRGSPRAVGSALAKNPFAPEVPCHRAVRSDGALGGFHGMTQGARMLEKHELLRSEGVAFDRSGRVIPGSFLAIFDSSKNGCAEEDANESAG
ncbi:MAG: MGMT family protein [Verrucomicrobia bacterium]|nr:MAG: MGMT family protein [Verrucomicrobiota bacterium]